MKDASVEIEKELTQEMGSSVANIGKEIHQTAIDILETIQKTLINE